MPEIPDIVAETLNRFAGKKLLMTWSGFSDFTQPSGPGNLVIHFTDGEQVVSLPVDRDVRFWGGILNGVLSNSMVIGYDIKPIYSWFKALKGSLRPSVVDLLLAESYVGIRSAERPGTLFEAETRFREVVSLEPRYANLWRSVFGPLVWEVLPAIESYGIGDSESEIRKHPCFHPEGSINGRLSCSASYSRGINAHNLSPEERSVLRVHSDECFLTFDFRQMEVMFAQWISQDPILAEDVQQSDAYSAIWRRCTNTEPNEKYRDLCKVSFLARLFGQGASSLSKSQNISEDIASELIKRYQQNYPVLFDYVKQFDNCDPLIDCFGRRRIVGEARGYVGRNFCIQSPAALVCIERLVSLYRAISEHARILYAVHDGYVVAAPKRGWRTICDAAIASLSSESPLAPGLRMSVKAKQGETLSSLVEI